MKILKLGSNFLNMGGLSVNDRSVSKSEVWEDCIFYNNFKDGYDDIINGVSPTWNVGTSLVEGKNGDCAKFTLDDSGIFYDDFFQAHSTEIEANGLSVSFWIKSTVILPDNFWGIICYIGALWITYNASKINFDLLGGTGEEYLTLNDPLSNNDWNQITVTIQPGLTGLTSIYINGALLSSKTNNDVDILNNYYFIKIGGDALSSTTAMGSFGGYFDEIGIWSKALTNEEVKVLYNSGNGIFYGVYKTEIPTNTEITIDYTKVEEDITDFPILINEDNFVTADFSEDINNLRFFDSDNNSIPHEVVNFTSGNTEIWVKTDLSSTVDTVISYNFEGEGTVDATDVWSNGFTFVTHCKVTDDTLYDSVNDTYSNTNTNMVSYEASTDAKFGSSARTTGNTTVFPYQASHNTPYTTQQLTIQAFVYQLAGGGKYIMSSNGNDKSIIYGYSGASFEHYASPRVIINDTITQDTFGYVNFSFDYTTDVGLRVYNDAINTVSTAGVLNSVTTDYNTLGINNSAQYDGYSDELRVASVTRTSGWFTTEYNMLMNTDTFYK